MNKQGIPIFGR